jgi:hypothetical protein
LIISAMLASLLALQATVPGPVVRPKTARAEAPQAAKNSESGPKQRGRQLLETAEAESAGIAEPGMRGYALLQLARVYGTFDRQKAMPLLTAAFSSVSLLDDDSNAKPRLQQQILEAMAPMDPQFVDEMLPQVSADARQATLQALLAYYTKNNRVDRALEVIDRISADGAFPFTAATKLMESLPAESSAQRQRLFLAALESFRAEKTPEGYAGPEGDFGEMLVRQSQMLPAAIVREAIDELLRKAESSDTGSMEMAMVGQSGSLSFNSRYEWRLFQLLPILRQIDESAAEAMLKKNANIQAHFQRYPQGMDSFQPADQASVTGTVLVTRDSSGPRTSAPPPLPPRATQMLQRISQMNNVLRDVREHPQNALTQALALPDDSTRLQTLMLVARATQKNKTTVCKSALDKVIDQVDRLELQEQVNLLVDAGRLYLATGENDGVKTVMQRGAAVAEQMYKADTNPDDPNQSSKAYWPSTNAWTNFVRLGAEVSPDVAIKLVNDIPDEEIRPAVRTALAAAWLGAPSGTNLIMRETKSGKHTLTGRGGEDEASTKR